MPVVEDQPGLVHIAGVIAQDQLVPVQGERGRRLHGAPQGGHRDLGLHLELLSRLNLPDRHRLLDDGTGRDLDFLRSALALLAIARNRVDGGAGAREDEEYQ